MTQQYEQAIHSYQLAIKLNPASAECHFNLASAYNDSGDNVNSMVHYKEAQKLDPENVDTILNIAETHEKLNEHFDAFNAYRQARTLQNNNVKALEGIEKLKPTLDAKGIKYTVD